MTLPYSSAPAGAGPAPVLAPRPKGPFVLASVLVLSTLAAAVLANGNIAVALAPTLTFLVGYVLVKVPLRYPWYVYITLVMTLDTPAERFAAGEWDSPLYPLAVVLSGQIKNVIPSGLLFMTGLDLMLVFTLVLHIVRRARHSPLDRDGYIGVPAPLVAASWLCLLGVLIAVGYGMSTGGNSRFVMWQIQRNIYLPIVFLLLQGVFPSPANYRAYLRILVVVACIRAVIAIWLRFPFPDVEYTTSHSDSMLFGTVSCLLVIRLFHRPIARDLWLGLPILGLLVWGMVANDRRLVWVEIGFAFAFILGMTPRNRFKIRLAQTFIASIPFLIVYIAAGWKSSSIFFRPVATLRSMVDSKSDGSSLWRELENFNLVSTFANHPVAGRGFGHPFEMAVGMPDITGDYELEPYLPHNSVVGLWAFTGYIGFTLIWLVPTVGLYVAARAYRLSTEPFDRTAALTCVCCVVIYELQCYGDMGLGSVISILLLAPSFAMIGKLAVKVGAWPAYRRSS